MAGAKAEAIPLGQGSRQFDAAQQARLSIDRQTTIDHLDPGQAPRLKGQIQLPTGTRGSAPKADRPLDRHGPALGRGINQGRPARSGGVGPLVVAGGETRAAGFNPDLQEPAGTLSAVDFTVNNAGARAHALDFARAQGGAMAHGIAVVQGTLHHHGDDFHVPVGMHAKALARPNTVIVDHQKRTKASPTGIKMAAKTKTMPAIEPPPLAVKTVSSQA